MDYKEYIAVQKERVAMFKRIEEYERLTHEIEQIETDRLYLTKINNVRITYKNPDGDIHVLLRSDVDENVSAIRTLNNHIIKQFDDEIRELKLKREAL